MCGRLWPVQEDLQRRLLQAGPDLEDACQMDRYRKLGWSRLHHQERRGEFTYSVSAYCIDPIVEHKSVLQGKQFILGLIGVGLW